MGNLTQNMYMRRFMRFCWLAFLLVLLVSPPSHAQSLLGEDAVFQSADYGNTDAVEKFLLTGNNPNIRDLKKVPLLHHAAIAGVPKTVTVLLGHGATVDLADNLSPHLDLGVRDALQ